MSEQMYLIAKADRETKRKKWPWLAAGGVVGAGGASAGLASGRSAERQLGHMKESADWMGNKYAGAVTRAQAHSPRKFSTNAVTTAMANRDFYRRGAGDIAEQARYARKGGLVLAGGALLAGGAIARTPYRKPKKEKR